MDGAGGNPGAGGFDPCECINGLQMNHQRAMERLTEILRNAQTTCTNNECFPGQLPGPGNPTGTTDDSNFSRVYLMIGLWFAFALLLFIFRPRTMRNDRDRQPKSINQGPRHNRQDPPEPELQ